jgi:hypothetical protein
MANYVRFVVEARSIDFGRRFGFAHAARDLREADRVDPVDRERLEELARWFNDNLAAPERFTRKRNASHRNHPCLSWFKDSASEHIRRAREVMEILSRYQVPGEMLVTATPGFVVYEDEFQVVAEPFRETPV